MVEKSEKKMGGDSKQQLVGCLEHSYFTDFRLQFQQSGIKMVKNKLLKVTAVTVVAINLCKKRIITLKLSHFYCLSDPIYTCYET